MTNMLFGAYLSSLYTSNPTHLLFVILESPSSSGPQGAQGDTDMSALGAIYLLALGAIDVYVL